MMNKTKNEGFSLVEVVIATFLFSIVSLALIKVIWLTRVQAENLAYDNITLSLAQGYMEQIRALGYSELQTTIEFPSNPLNVAKVADISGSAKIKDDPIFVGIVNTKNILADIVDPDDTTIGKEMSVDLIPSIEKIESVYDIEALLITLTYSYEIDSASGGKRTKTDELRSVVAKIN